MIKKVRLILGVEENKVTFLLKIYELIKKGFKAV